MDSALVCGSCAWFGVYRSDVAAQLSSCPNCGGRTLVPRDMTDPTWQELGAGLIGATDASFSAPPHGA